MKPSNPPAKVKPVPQRRITDIDDVKFPLRAVIAVVAFTTALVGSTWAITSSIRSDIGAIITRMDAQREIDLRDKAAAAREADAERRMLDGRLGSIDKRIDDIERGYKLGDYDIKGLVTEALRAKP